LCVCVFKILRSHARVCVCVCVCVWRGELCVRDCARVCL
jgi:hypothetical protein